MAGGVCVWFCQIFQDIVTEFHIQSNISHRIESKVRTLYTWHRIKWFQFRQKELEIICDQVRQREKRTHTHSIEISGPKTTDMWANRAKIPTKQTIAITAHGIRFLFRNSYFICLLCARFKHILHFGFIIGDGDDDDVVVVFPPMILGVIEYVSIAANNKHKHRQTNHHHCYNRRCRRSRHCFHVECSECSLLFILSRSHDTASCCCHLWLSNLIEV